MRWQSAELTAAHLETPSARTLTLHVPGWPGHLPGQHVDVRLTAPDGYQAVRSYSLAAPADGETVVLTVQRVPDGEVSGYLVDDLPVGAQIEIRGPVGGWFVWNPDRGGAALLIAGGSGIVPLAAMLRAHRNSADTNPFRLIYSLRDSADLYYRTELTAVLREPPGRRERAPGSGDRAAQSARRPGVDDSAGRGETGRLDGLGGAAMSGRGSIALQEESHRSPGSGDVDVFCAFTRVAPPGSERPAGRLTAEEIVRYGIPPSPDVTCYVCGPTGFVEFVAGTLVSLGYDPGLIRTERFGPTGK
ncbi:FAD-binding oxidoreductase [Nocardia sp. NPDC020380]|uniref:FAD-binding oxidoreductase n=1 Tax=Nocardia sp. NPDC020380 TaxID=3364309 RepID=UPI00378DD5E7